MAVQNLKTWKMDHDSGLLVSPRFPDRGSYDRCRKFLIRSGINADYDDLNYIVKIKTKGDTGRTNLEKLKKMEIL